MGKSKKRKSIEARDKQYKPSKNQFLHNDVGETINKVAEGFKGLMTQDAFQNQMARIGYGQPNLLEGTQYPIKRMTFNYNLFNSLYRGSWIVRKVIDVPASDMIKNWIKLSSQISPDAIDQFDRVIRATQTRNKILQGLKWGRLYGGAGALIILEGQEDILDQPLDLNTIMPGDYKGLVVFDRWSGITPVSGVETDVNSPGYGEPEFYNITTENNTIVVHHSRILRFAGRELPYWEKIVETYWGESEVEIIYEELKKRDNTSYNLAYLIFLANLRVLKMNDLGQMFATQSASQKQYVYDLLEAQNHLMSNMGVYVMDKDDDFETKQYSFSGLNEVYESFMLDISGACEMPVTKLFGRSPAGFNATGEGDLTHYDETIEEKQRSTVAPVLDKLLPIVALSTWGEIPKDFDWTFNPVRKIEEKDRIELARIWTDNVINAFNAGLVSDRKSVV